MSLIEQARFLTGIDEFNRGHYFEAHEEWEAVWLELIGADKTLCQALIQIAAGYHKLEIGGINGARKLIERGLALLQSTDERRAGLDLSDFRAAVSADLDRLRRIPFGATADLTVVRPPRLSVP